MRTGGVTMLLAALAFVATSVRAPAAQRVADPDMWETSIVNVYWKDAEIARNLRCAALIETSAALYFATRGKPSEKLAGIPAGLSLSAPPPVLSAAEKAEGEAYVRAAQVFADRAETLTRKRPDYDAKKFKETYFEGVGNASRFLKKGQGLAALNAAHAHCLADPAAAPVAAPLRARLALPVPGARKLASPRIEPEWMPPHLAGYLYDPQGYRYLGCSSLVLEIGRKRFGYIPDAGEAPGFDWENAGTGARLAGEKAATRRGFKRLADETYRAGLAAVKARTPAEIKAYRASYSEASKVIRRYLVSKDLLGEAMREPSLRCAELPSMAGLLALDAAPAVATPPAKPIQGWPDRTLTYLAEDASFRPLFCSALVYVAYNRRASEKAWFRPPSSDDDRPPARGGSPSEYEPFNPADQGERMAVRQAIFALYARGQFNDAAKRDARWTIGEYAKAHSRAIDAAETILQVRQGLRAFNEASTNCASLPELEPVLDKVIARLGR